MSFSHPLQELSRNAPSPRLFVLSQQKQPSPPLSGWFNVFLSKEPFGELCVTTLRHKEKLAILCVSGPCIFPGKISTNDGFNFVNRDNFLHVLGLFNSVTK